MSLGFAQRNYLSFVLTVSLLTIEAKACSGQSQNIFGTVNGSVYFSFQYNGSHSYDRVSITNDNGYRLMYIYIYPGRDSFRVRHMSERINLTRNFSSGDISFILNDLQTSDSGNYTLTSRRTAVESCSTLYILGKPTVPVISYELPTTVTVGRVLDLHCMSNSTTVPPGLPLTYTWYRNSQSISRDRRFTVSGPMLTIHYVVKEDQSDALACIAMEKMNISTESDPTRIKVFRPPDPPFHVSVYDVTASTIYLNWTLDPNVGANEKVRIEYRSASMDWVLAGVLYTQQGITIDNLISETMYLVRLSAGNDYGWNEEAIYQFVATDGTVTETEESISTAVITGSTIGVLGVIAALITIGIVLHRRQINAKSSPSTNREIASTQDQGMAYEDLFIVQTQTQQYEAIQMTPQVSGDVVSSDQGDDHLYNNVQV